MVLERIVDALGESATPDALARLEREFESSFLVVAGDANDVASHSEQLRLAITTEECGIVLDHLAVQITIEQGEGTINSLFPDRFVEP